MTIRMVGGWVFLLVPAHLGSPRQMVVKRLLLLLCCCLKGLLHDLLFVVTWCDKHWSGLLKQVALYNTCSNIITCTTYDVTSSYGGRRDKRAWVVSSFVCFCNVLDKSSDAWPASRYLRIWYYSASIEFLLSYLWFTFIIKFTRRAISFIFVSYCVYVGIGRMPQKVVYVTTTTI